MRDQAPQPDARHLLRRWIVDYFNRHDAAACADFIAPDYALRIGNTVFAGRDTEWLPAVDQQMQAFPGLAMTVHHVVSGDGWAAAYFSEHGASQGRAACWSGIGIYFSDGTVLTSCIAQEDYMTRARQLKGGTPDPVEAPAVAPWDDPAAPANPEAESIVRAWLGTGWPLDTDAIRVDDEHITGNPLKFTTQEVEIDCLLSSGDEVVFHAVQTGQYEGGLPKVETSGPAYLHVNGILKVQDGKVVSGRVIRDRMALRAVLQEASS